MNKIFLNKLQKLCLLLKKMERRLFMVFSFEKNEKLFVILYVSKDQLVKEFLLVRLSNKKRKSTNTDRKEFVVMNFVHSVLNIENQLKLLLVFMLLILLLLINILFLLLGVEKMLLILLKNCIMKVSKVSIH